MGPVCSELESVESVLVGISDVVGLVLMTVEAERLVVSSGDDGPWDAVCAGGEPLGEGENLDVVTSVWVI